MVVWLIGDKGYVHGLSYHCVGVAISFRGPCFVRVGYTGVVTIGEVGGDL